MKLIRRIVLLCLAATLVCSLSGISAFAIECNTDSVVQKTEEDQNTNRVTRMSGAGSVSTGQMSIYYPAGSIGYISIVLYGATVMTVSADGTGTYTGSIGALTARNYGLTLIVMTGSTPTVAAEGTLVISQ